MSNYNSSNGNNSNIEPSNYHLIGPGVDLRGAHLEGKYLREQI